jgi:hypothetical protein
VQRRGCTWLRASRVRAGTSERAETDQNAAERPKSEGISAIPKHLIDESEMARLYMDEGMTQKQVGDAFGISQQTVGRRLLTLGIEVHSSHVIELAPIPDDVNDEDRRKLVYIRGEVIDQKHGKREQDDIDLLCGTYRDVLRRYAPAQQVVEATWT